jgi:hypothetical protein
LTSSLGGRASLLAYLEHDLAWLSLPDGSTPIPGATLHLEASIRDGEPLRKYALARMKETGGRVRALQLRGGVTRYVSSYDGADVHVEIGKASARVSLGDLQRRRPLMNLGEQLRSRFGGGAFGPGHASLLVDLGALRAELGRPMDLDGLSDEEVEQIHRYTSVLLWQTGPVEHLFADLEGAEGGLKVRAELKLDLSKRELDSVGTRR